MSTVRCFQCSAAVPADNEYCPECGYPLDWRAAADEPDGSQTDEHMVRLPGEAAGADPTKTMAQAPPGPPQQPEMAGPTVACPSCGAINPAERTLCERCGMGLNISDDVLRGEVRRGGRLGWVVLLAVVVLAGAAVGWFVLVDRDDAIAEAADTAQEPDATASESASAAPADTEVLLEEGARGDDVRQWQELLQAADLDVSVDGQFGPQTTEATRTFQAQISEEPTGQVTAFTIAAAQRASSLREVDIFLIRDGELDAVARLVDEALLARSALRALLAAPLQAERDDGLRSAIPSQTVLNSIDVDGGTAVVALSGFAADPGPKKMRRRVDQVVETLTQFGSIDTVRFQLTDDDVRAFADAGVVVSDPLPSSDG